jgi:hypothetical protein
MFNFFTKTKKTTEPTFEVRQLSEGNFGIVATDGTTVIGQYTRKADAIRGATRKGITLANA